MDENIIKNISIAWENIKNAIFKIAESFGVTFAEILDTWKNTQEQPKRKQKFNIMHAKVKHLKSQVLLNKPKFIQQVI